MPALTSITPSTRKSVVFQVFEPHADGDMRPIDPEPTADIQDVCDALEYADCGECRVKMCVQTAGLSAITDVTEEFAQRMFDAWRWYAVINDEGDWVVPPNGAGFIAAHVPEYEAYCEELVAEDRTERRFQDPGHLSKGELI